jgi:tetratricopeptide (TPR) repeat protein
MNRKERRAATKHGRPGGQGGSPDLQKAFADALRYHQAGYLNEAEIGYRQILAVDGRHADSLHLLGVIATQVGRHDLAVDLIGKAIAIDGQVDSYHSNLGFALQQLGRLDDAIASYRKALRLKPRFPEAHNNLGNALLQQGRMADAAAAYRQAIALNPAYPEAHNNLGLALLGQGGLDEAVACYRKAIDFRPDYLEAHHNLGSALREQGYLDEAVTCCRKAIELNANDAEAHNTLGAVYQKQGLLDEAIACYRKACDLRADYPDARYNLGTVFQDQERFSDADACYRMAIALKPDYRQAYNNLGTVFLARGRPMDALSCFGRAIALKPEDPESHNNVGTAKLRLGRLEEAVAHYRHAIVLDPDNPQSLFNLGNVLQEQGRLQDALVCLDKALELQPDHPEAHWNRGLVLLLAGEFERGWEDYEWRWRHLSRKGQKIRTFPQPLWRGERSDGGTILLWAEQGAGDSIQFVRYAAMVAERGWHVVIEAPHALKRLFDPLPDVLVIPEGEALPSFDVHCPLLSLPRALRTTLPTIPASIPYLRVDKALGEEWRDKLRGDTGFRLGVAWRGDSSHKRDQTRSMEANLFSRILDGFGGAVISLQKDGRVAEIASLGSGVLDAGPALGDYADTAALIANLDLVISVDTSVCHLAGALGVPTWTLLEFCPDWRWLTDREDSPWYPGMRLFRQRKAGDWRDVIERVREALLCA